MGWQPKYTLTPRIAQHLMRIEAARAVVAHTPLPPAVEAEIRRRARIRSTHYSTRIEGNRLTLAEAEQILEGRTVRLYGREQDVREVKNYWEAFLKIEAWATEQRPLSEELLCQLHALVERGKQAKPTPYRDGQNVIRDATTGAILYLPPMASDVPALMASLVAWVQAAEQEGLPIPLIAGLAHYQFVTIHPFYDGNGRTARLLATFLLHRGGYGLNGFFSLEEYHARDLDVYYQALVAHPHHNYYEGRADADLTDWLTYFTETMTRVFLLAEEEALRFAKENSPSLPDEIRGLDRRARVVFALFTDREQITAREVAVNLGVAERTARDLLQEWVKAGWLVIANTSNRTRTYTLSAEYRRFIGGLSAEGANLAGANQRDAL